MCGPGNPIQLLSQDFANPYTSDFLHCELDDKKSSTSEMSWGVDVKQKKTFHTAVNGHILSIALLKSNITACEAMVSTYQGK